MSLQLGAPTHVERVVFTPQRGFTFCHVDLSNLRDATEAIATIERAMREMREMADHAPRSLRVLTDFTGSKMSQPVVEALEVMARANEPFVDRSAVIGLALQQRVALRQLRRATGRDIREYDSRDAAMNYLLA